METILRIQTIPTKHHASSWAHQNNSLVCGTVFQCFACPGVIKNECRSMALGHLWQWWWQNEAGKCCLVNHNVLFVVFFSTFRVCSTAFSTLRVWNFNMLDCFKVTCWFQLKVEHRHVTLKLPFQHWRYEVPVWPEECEQTHCNGNNGAIHSIEIHAKFLLGSMDVWLLRKVEVWSCGSLPH